MTWPSQTRLYLVKREMSGWNVSHNDRGCCGALQSHVWATCYFIVHLLHYSRKACLDRISVQKAVLNSPRVCSLACQSFFFFLRSSLCVFYMNQTWVFFVYHAVFQVVSCVLSVVKCCTYSSQSVSIVIVVLQLHNAFFISLPHQYVRCQMCHTSMNLLKLV